MDFVTLFSSEKDKNFSKENKNPLFNDNNEISEIWKNTMDKWTTYARRNLSFFNKEVKIKQNFENFDYL